MFKNKKFLIIFFLTAFILIFSFSSCFAVAVTSSNAQTIYNQVEDYCTTNNITIYDYIITSDGYVYVATRENYSMYVNHLWDGDFINCTGCTIFYFGTEDSFNVAVSSTNGSNYTEVTESEGKYITYSSYDVLDSDGVLFFLQTPLRMGVLAPIVEKVEMIPVMKEIVGVLPLIIVVVVSLVGLRKALRMLSTLLRKA
ncbi:MAG: hypothetical protein ACI4VQ_07110 [Clostridia bacterium]